MFQRVIQVKRVHGAGRSEDTEIVIANEKFHANGVFSNVYRAQLLLPTKQDVAIKKVWVSKAGAESVAQEIDLLRRVGHPNVVSLLYYFRLKTDNEVCDCLIFDFMPTDLSKLRTQMPDRRFHPLDAKLYSWQIFAGIDHINACGITHFDLKPSNMIVDDRFGLLKIADFGNAKIVKRHDKMDSYQVTRYYRAPELAFGTSEFTTAIDRWAAACVLAELILGKPLLSGRDNVDQGRVIIDVLGYPSSEQCKAMQISKPRLSRKTGRGLKAQVFGTDFPALALDIIERTLIYEPQLRLKTQIVMGHPYFDGLRLSPAPVRVCGIPIPPLNYWITEQKTQSNRPNKRPRSPETTSSIQDLSRRGHAKSKENNNTVLKKWWFW